MAASPSFDIVSKVDRQEVDNAFHQAEKELATRFDFRGTGTEIAKSGEAGVTITSETEERVSAALDVFKEKLVKRQQSLKILDAGEPRQSGRESKISIALKEGITSEDAKKVSALPGKSGYCLRGGKGGATARVYVVARGDNLGDIAERFGVEGRSTNPNDPSAR